MIKELSISGFRGFGELQTVCFSLPDGKSFGSGLTIITGANNSGKTTIIESIKAFNGDNAPAFSEGKRNNSTDGLVSLKLLDENDTLYSVNSILGGGSSSKRNGLPHFRSYIVQSRRAVPFEFHRSYGDKNWFLNNSMKLESQRSSSLNNFDVRLFQIEEEKEIFDKVLCSVLGKDFSWAIEQRDSGQYYIKYIQNGISHSSEGIGDGIWSIFTICAALYDSSSERIIVIDEPELSLHPSLQKKLLNLLLVFSKDIQIIICTHSPYFISWEAIMNGGSLIRVVKEGKNSKCYCLNDNCKKVIKGLITDQNNPHVLGIEASEVFFLDDSIILVEGQEDVVIYRKIIEDLEISLGGEFFGWGVGGAAKMNSFLSMFESLGYKRIVVIFDGDKETEFKNLKDTYPQYKFFILPEDDIRNKKEYVSKAKSGIVDDKRVIKKEYVSYIRQLFNEINIYFDIH